MPFVGFLVADGRWNLWAAILVTSMGSIVGSLISYTMGYYGGKPFVLRVGRYLLLDPHDLTLAEKFFSKKGGTVTIFISRFVPVVRHLISVPAGIGKMALLPFLGATLVGATLHYVGQRAPLQHLDLTGASGLDLEDLAALRGRWRTAPPRPR